MYITFQPMYLSIIDTISQPWHWAVSGAAISFLVFSMTYLGKRFGISGFYETMCTYAGAGKKNKFFQKDVSLENWRFIFIIGAIIGGYIAHHYLQSPNPVAISQATTEHLAQWNMSPTENQGYLPNFFNIGNPLAVVLAIISGFLIGFGTRYGKGCTSGHAITGLSHLKLTSLVTVIGFFIGGLIMTWVIMPLIFG